MAPAPNPVCRRNPGMLYGLGNIAENAVDFARSRVRIYASWTHGAVTIVIADDGPGVTPHVLARLGEPYVTTRGAARDEGETGGGLGLGLFIAETFNRAIRRRHDNRQCVASGHRSAGDGRLAAPGVRTRSTGASTANRRRRRPCRSVTMLAAGGRLEHGQWNEQAKSRLRLCPRPNRATGLC